MHPYEEDEDFAGNPQPPWVYWLIADVCLAELVCVYLTQ